MIRMTAQALRIGAPIGMLVLSLVTRIDPKARLYERRQLMTVILRREP
jgi:hypothetical protein